MEMVMELGLTRIFVKVAQNGSFSRAADILKIPKSTVSKAVSKLENETGTKLIIRTTRSLTLTAAGRAFYEASLGPITQLEDAQKSLYGQDTLLTGLVRLTAPEDLGSMVIAPIIAKLALKHPELTFDLEYTDEIIDLVSDGFDLAVRLGRLGDSALRVKRVGEVSLVPVASMKYLKPREKIRTPSDLKNHMCLSLNLQGVGNRWALKSEKGTATVSIRSSVTSNQTSSLLQMATAGGGIALVPMFLCKPYLVSGELVRVLPEWSSQSYPASILTPLAPSSSARLKLTVNEIAAGIAEALVP